MPIQANYLGMPLSLDDLDVENLAYFKHCAAHDFHLQALRRLRAAALSADHRLPVVHEPRSRNWVPVEGKGAVHSYTEVHHAIQPAFKAHTPYLVLLVDLDTQKGKPTEHEALRVVGNLAHAGRQAGAAGDGEAGRHRHARAHGVRRRGPGLALPQWTIDEAANAARQALALSAGVRQAAA